MKFASAIAFLFFIVLSTSQNHINGRRRACRQQCIAQSGILCNAGEWKCCKSSNGCTRNPSRNPNSSQKCCEKNSIKPIQAVVQGITIDC